MIDLSKVSFGATSAIVTGIGLVVGFGAANASRTGLVAAFLIVALADNLTDTLSIHVYQESEKLNGGHALAATLGNFTTRLGICATFILLVLSLPRSYVVTGSLAWGLVLLCGLTWLVARSRGANVGTEMFKHLAVAVVVIAVSGAVGSLILGLPPGESLPGQWCFAQC